MFTDTFSSTQAPPTQSVAHLVGRDETPSHISALVLLATLGLSPLAMIPPQTFARTWGSADTLSIQVSSPTDRATLLLQELTNLHATLLSEAVELDSASREILGQRRSAFYLS